MSRYIDADALKWELDNDLENAIEKANPISPDGLWAAIALVEMLKEGIDNMPHIDIVFCKECMHQAKQTLIQGEIYDMPCCKKGMRISNDNGFCSYGEREDE